MRIIDLTEQTDALPVFLVDPSGHMYTAGPVALPAGTDRGGSITTANAAQQVAPANALRLGLTFQNTSDTAMKLTENGADATASTGYLIAPGVSVNIATSNSISVFCASAGKTFAGTEY